MNLKLKAKALAAEARLTRAEELKLRDRLRLENCPTSRRYGRLIVGKKHGPLLGVCLTTDLAILRRSRLFEKARDRWIKHHGRVDAFMAAHAGPKDAAFQQRADRLQREARAWARFHRHRTHEVRREARSVALARAFLAGKDYTDVESPYTRTRPDWNRVAELLMYRHMDQDFKRRWDEWRDAADRYLLAQHRIDPYTFPEGIRRHHNIVMGVDAMSGELVHG